MKRIQLFINVCLMSTLLFWGLGGKAQSYDRLWKQAEQAQKQSRPQTVIELTDRIYRKALVEKNAGQLFKAYICRENFKQTLTPDSLSNTLLYMENWVEKTQDKVEKAILHSLLAEEYVDYWNQNRREVSGRSDLAVDEPIVDIRTWSSRQFIEQVDRHSFIALSDVNDLLGVQTSDYQPFIVLEDASAYYGHDFYHLLASRSIGFYQNMMGSGADSLMRNRIDSLYIQMLDVYSHRKNGADAVILTTLDYWKWKMGSYVNRMPYLHVYARDWELESAYIKTLDELIARYADYPVVLEAYIRKAEWMSHGGKGQSIAEAIRLCDEGIRRYPSYNRIGELHSIRAELLRPQISLCSEGISYPGDTLRLNVTYRTLDTPVMLNVYATNLKTYPDSYDWNNNKDFHQCAPNRIYTAKHTFRPLPSEGKLPADVPYLPSDTVLSLPLPVVPGVYVVEVVPQAKNGRKVRRFLSVSRLRVLTLDLEDGSIEVTTLDNCTGKPISEVTVDFYSDAGNLLKSVVTGADGKAIVTWQEKNYAARYVAHKGEDAAMEPQRIFLRKKKSLVSGISYNVSLLIDRSIYRPGQTVYVKGVAYGQNEDSAHVVEQGTQFDIELFDANRRQIATRKVKTNNWGSFVTDFVIPEACLNGRFSISAKGKANASVYFQVEEYKRPTFEITFQPIDVSYCLGEAITLYGQVKAFSGVTVQNKPLAYRVTWNRALRPYGFSHDNHSKADTVQLDADGRFSIKLKLDASDIGTPGLYDPIQFYTYIYNIEANVTDEAGETQTAFYSFPVRKEAFSLDASLPIQVCKEDTGRWVVRAYNAASISQNLDVRWRIDRETKDNKLMQVKPLLSGICRTDTFQSYSLWQSLPSGNYRLTISATDSLGHHVESYRNFVWFSKYDTRPPVHIPLFYHEGCTEVAVGENAFFHIGTSFKDACLLVDVFTGGKRVESRMIQLSDTLMFVQIPYLKQYGESMSVLFNLLREGQLYSQTVQLKKKQPDMHLDMKWQVFRDRLRPGQDEEWKLVISTPDGLPATAEVLALMYDASLDKLYRNHPQWGVFFYRGLDWRSVQISNLVNLYMSPYYTIPDWEKPSLRFDHFCPPYPDGLLSFGENATAAVVLGYGTARNAALTGSVLMKSRSAAAPDAVASIKENGVTVETDYEAPMAGGVLQEEEVESGVSLQPLEYLRTDFAETAFFYPDLRTDEQGKIIIAFTMPQSLTRWNFRSYAHTKQMLTGTLEASVVTAKEFMLHPNLPRFIRVGDHAQIAATVSNLTDKQVKGTVVLQLFDPETEKTVKNYKQKFEVGSGRNVSVSFDFEVSGHYDLLGVRLTADGGSFSDGEQHLLPVLSNKEQVTEALTFDLQGVDECTLSLDTLFNHNSPSATNRRLTVEVTGNPTWLAIQALPALTQPGNEDALSWAAAYYANELAKAMADSQSRIKMVLDAWKASNVSGEAFHSRLEQNQELKNMLLSETPWLIEATDETARMQRLVQLFDTNRQNNLRISILTRLKDLQSENGAWSWYKGMCPSREITTYIATLLIRLPQLTGKPLEGDALQMKRRALDYLHKEALEEYRQMRRAEQDGHPVETLSSLAIDYMYLLALDGNEVPADSKTVHAYFLKRVPRLLTDTSMQRKAQGLVILLANGRHTEADNFEVSLKEHLIHDGKLGAHFAFNDGYYSWGMMPVSVHVATMEALLRAGDNEELIEDMKRWLLKQKQTVAWNTPVASADAIYALLHSGRNGLADRGDVCITLGREHISTVDVTDSTRPLQGLGYVKESFAEGNAVLKAKTITVEKRDTGMAWGAVYAQYLSPVTDVKQQGEDLTVEKQLYVERQDASGHAALYSLSEGAGLHVGDKVVTRLVIRLERAMDYVQLKDCRAACLEPSAILSGYRRNGSFAYYAETKDASNRFFFEHLGKGVYVLEYSCRVSHAGIYQSGLATVQCAYSPEMVGHSGNNRSLCLEVENGVE